MNSNRKTSIIVGVLYITGTAAEIISAVFGPDTNTLDYLAKLSANQNRVMTGALLEFTMAILTVGIPIFLYPIL
jgi:hypothetical protein